MDLSLEMVQGIPGVLKHHWKEGTFNWFMIFYIGICHVMAGIGIGYLKHCSAHTLIWAWLLWPISGYGIICGVHRLWAHRSYEASFPLRVMLMLQQSMSNEGSIFHWSRDHRVHHKFSETAADPHDATRGFFFAHMGWLLVKKHKSVVEAGRDIDLSDLQEDPVVMFQKRLDPWLSLYMCFIFPAQVAQYCWGENFWNAFFVGDS